MAPSPVGCGGFSRVLDFSSSPQCRGNTRCLSYIGKHGSHIEFTVKMLLGHVLIHILRIRHVLGRRCVVRYVLGLRYVIRRSVKRATGGKCSCQLLSVDNACSDSWNRNS